MDNEFKAQFQKLQAAAHLFVLSQGLGQTAGIMMLTPAVKLLRSQMDNAWLIANSS